MWLLTPCALCVCAYCITLCWLSISSCFCCRAWAARIESPISCWVFSSSEPGPWSHVTTWDTAKEHHFSLSVIIAGILVISKWTIHKHFCPVISWDTFTAHIWSHLTKSEITHNNWLDLCWIRSVTVFIRSMMLEEPTRARTHTHAHIDQEIGHPSY